MKKKALSLLLVLVLVFPLCTVSAGGEYYLTENRFLIKLNGKDMQSDLPLMNYNGNTYVPLRAVSEGSGLIVNFQEETSTIYIANMDKYNIQTLVMCLDTFKMIERIYHLLRESNLALNDAFGASANTENYFILTDLNYAKDYYGLANDYVDILESKKTCFYNAPDDQAIIDNVISKIKKFVSVADALCSNSIDNLNNGLSLSYYADSFYKYDAQTLTDLYREISEIAREGYERYYDAILDY